MRAVNPAFIPRNHRIEAVIEAAVEREDFAPFEELLWSWRSRTRTSRVAAYASRRSPNSACCRRSAERDVLTRIQHHAAAAPAAGN